MSEHRIIPDATVVRDGLPRPKVGAAYTFPAEVHADIGYRAQPDSRGRYDCFYAILSTPSQEIPEARTQYAAWALTKREAVEQLRTLVPLTLAGVAEALAALESTCGKGGTDE